MTGPGFDYSMGAPHPVTGGPVNMDPETSIRYGVICANNIHLSEWLWESVDTIYYPRCPGCGDVIPASDLDEGTCPGCGESFDPDDSDALYGDEPDENIIRETTSDGPLEGFIDSGNDLWVVRSPYYTRGTFCSPCAPGAGSIGAPHPDGPRIYTLPLDWWENETPPGPIYRVSDGTRVWPAESDSGSQETSS